MRRPSADASTAAHSSAAAAATSRRPVMPRMTKVPTVDAVGAVDGDVDGSVGAPQDAVGCAACDSGEVRSAWASSPPRTNARLPRSSARTLCTMASRSRRIDLALRREDARHDARDATDARVVRRPRQGVGEGRLELDRERGAARQRLVDALEHGHGEGASERLDEARRRKRTPGDDANAGHVVTRRRAADRRPPGASRRARRRRRAPWPRRSRGRAR